MSSDRLPAAMVQRRPRVHGSLRHGAGDHGVRARARVAAAGVADAPEGSARRRAERYGRPPMWAANAAHMGPAGVATGDRGGGARAPSSLPASNQSSRVEARYGHAANTTHNNTPPPAWLWRTPASRDASAGLSVPAFFSRGWRARRCSTRRRGHADTNNSTICAAAPGAPRNPAREIVANWLPGQGRRAVSPRRRDARPGKRTLLTVTTSETSHPRHTHQRRHETPISRGARSESQATRRARAVAPGLSASSNAPGECAQRSVPVSKFPLRPSWRHPHLGRASHNKKQTSPEHCVGTTRHCTRAENNHRSR
eukprot:353689-Chlamydomonas_euryale.AAC.3